MTSETSSQRTITAHDTLQRLSYAKRPAFDVLWEPKDIAGINVRATERRRILGDEYLESIIKERPRRYMTPSVSLDDVRDTDKRKLMTNFIYKTTVNQAAKEVWNDFEVRDFCLPHVEEREKPLTDQRVIAHLPARFRGVAKKWDSMQNRSYLDDTCYAKTKDKLRKVECINEIQAEIQTDKEISERNQYIRKLIDENKLSIVYDKLPLSYTGHRPYIAYGVPLEKKEAR